MVQVDGTRCGSFGSSCDTSRGVRCCESAASLSSRSENEHSRKIARTCARAAPPPTARSVGPVSPEKTTDRPSVATMYPKVGTTWLTAYGVTVSDPAANGRPSASGRYRIVGRATEGKRVKSGQVESLKTCAADGLEHRLGGEDLERAGMRPWTVRGEEGERRDVIEVRVRQEDLAGCRRCAESGSASVSASGVEGAALRR